MNVKLISSLEKCFLDEDISVKREFTSASCLKGEIFHFGVCYKPKELQYTARPIKITVKSEIADCITVNQVEHVAVKLPVYGNIENNDYLRTTAGLYPDMLVPVNRFNRLLLSNNLESLFIEVDTNKTNLHGKFAIELAFSDFDTDKLLSTVTFNLEIINHVLPPQELVYTQWFYCDCLADYYNVEVFSEKHWQIIENFLACATKNGINAVLTPVFTPPLDTYVGGERTTVQLVKITANNGTYTFDFSKLERWINLCKKVGVIYFEISHFFTQWGAKHAPKIIVSENGVQKQIFGWQTDATSPEYSDFLNQFLPALIEFLKSMGIDKQCFFHISDEPSKEHIPTYSAARSIVAPHLKGYKITDALSNYEFYEQGIVTSPIPATNHIQDFINHNVPDLWCYYCCGQHKDVANRFISMPSYRNRIIAVQMYKYNIKGFLHWGYNYYNSQFSYNSINPFLSTDCEYFAPSGDGYSVYPAPNGTPYESIRLCVFSDALCDLRAMLLLEKFIGQDGVQKIIDDTAKSDITFSDYPRSDDFILTLREKINTAIKENI